MGPKARDAVPALIEALRDRVAIVHEDAARALRRIGPDARVAVPDLTEVLRSRFPDDDYLDFGARARTAMAATLLALDGKTVEVAFPLLRDALGDRAMSVREAAAAALSDVGPAARAAVPDLLAVFRESRGARKARAPSSRLPRDRLCWRSGRRPRPPSWTP